MIGLNDQHLMVREFMRKYLEKEVEPLVADIDEGKVSAVDVIRKMIKVLGLGGRSGSASKKDVEKKRSEASETGVSAMRDPYMTLISSVEISRVCPSLAMVLG